MLNEIKYAIGKVEVEDQIDVTNQLINLYPFIGKGCFAYKILRHFIVYWNTK